MRKSNTTFWIVVVILCAVDLAHSTYLAYFFILFLFIIRAKSFSLSVGSYQIKAFLLIIGFSLLKVFQLNLDSIRDIGLLSLGLICYFNRCNLILNIKSLNLTIACLFFLTFIREQNSFSLSFTSFLSSDMGFESTMLSFIFPFFFFYWLLKNDKWMIALNILLVLLAGKRIGMLAIAFSSFYYLVAIKKNFGGAFSRRKLVFYNFLYLFVSYLFVTGYFDEFIGDNLGLTANEVTMGRQELYSGAINIKNDIFTIILFGIGFGHISSFIGADGELLHNDILRIFVENGLFVFISFFYLFYKGVTLRQKGYLLTWNIIFLTDNTLIYAPVIFTVFFFLWLERCHSI